ncbi:MAG TPA: thioesterase domain-containing protein, partial [Thermosynechococcaceae cyanobacterium]
MERTQLQQQVERSRFEEPELAIDPAFFHALRDRFPQIQQVQIRLSRGRSHNEMTQFRYNVLLHLEPLRASKAQTLLGSTAHGRSQSIQQHDWQRDPITVEAMQTQLRETEPEQVLIANVANSRVQAAVQTANWLRSKDTPKTVGRMRETLQDSVALAIDPEDWWALETVLPYTVEITWSMHTDTGAYDVLLTRHGVAATIAVPLSQSLSQSGQPYTNEPLQSNFARQLIPELRHHLKQTLPDYMVPSAFMPLETLPLTVNGKVDRRALPALSDTIHSSSTTIAPSTQTESTLIDIWQELLRLKQVTVHDNFFELGGHSLLATQMTSRIRDAFGLELPLQSVFATPTIAQLAPILETLRAAPSLPKVPPLVRLDRAAHRRSRSPQSSVPAQALQDLAPQDLALQDLPIQVTPSPNDQVASEQAITARSPLVPLTLGGSKQPFFCVHPMFGVVFPYLELAQQLGSDRSFYGLQPLGLDGKHVPLTEIEAIAAYYIQAMQTLQPHGPYFLGGWSFGGLVAFEMAQQLTRAGQQVGLLAMLDTPAPASHQPSLGQSLKFLLGTALWSTLPFLLDYGAIAANRLGSLSWLSRWQWTTLIRRLPEASRLQLLDESAIAPMLRIVYANAQSAYHYVPQPYPDRITLFKATEQADVFGQDSTLGWSTLTKDVQLHSVPGNHLSLLKQPHV